MAGGLSGEYSHHQYDDEVARRNTCDHSWRGRRSHDRELAPFRLVRTFEELMRTVWAWKRLPAGNLRQ
jgi:hypothetical protein